MTRRVMQPAELPRRRGPMFQAQNRLHAAAAGKCNAIPHDCLMF